jgi:hypothetical protein
MSGVRLPLDGRAEKMANSAASSGRDQRVRERIVRIVFSFNVWEITIPGVVARAPRALAVDNAEQAASRSKAAGQTFPGLRYRSDHRYAHATISTYLIELRSVNV